MVRYVHDVINIPSSIQFHGNTEWRRLAVSKPLTAHTTWVGMELPGITHRLSHVPHSVQGQPNQGQGGIAALRPGASLPQLHSPIRHSSWDFTHKG